MGLFERDPLPGPQFGVPGREPGAQVVERQFGMFEVHSESQAEVLRAGEVVLEVEPAAYITLAANEAEKAAPVFLNHMSSVGVYGRVWMSGTESGIAAAREAALTAINAITGK